VKLLPRTVTSIVSPGCAFFGPPGCDAVVQCELDVDGVGVRVGVNERVAELMLLVAVGEPHPDPHRRVQWPIGEHAAGFEVQPQVVGG
jgi:hypothetical protein